jgi:hypothetical protein
MYFDSIPGLALDQTRILNSDGQGTLHRLVCQQRLFRPRPHFGSKLAKLLIWGLLTYFHLLPVLN